VLPGTEALEGRAARPSLLDQVGVDAATVVGEEVPARHLAGLVGPEPVVAAVGQQDAAQPGARRAVRGQGGGAAVAEGVREHPPIIPVPVQPDGPGVGGA
jgi:hypothetical protein